MIKFYLVFFILLCAAQFALTTYTKVWPTGTGKFPDPKFFYGPALATGVLIVTSILF